MLKAAEKILPLFLIFIDILSIELYNYKNEKQSLKRSREVGKMFIMKEEGARSALLLCCAL